MVDVRNGHHLLRARRFESTDGRNARDCSLSGADEGVAVFQDSLNKIQALATVTLAPTPLASLKMATAVSGSSISVMAFRVAKAAREVNWSTPNSRLDYPTPSHSVAASFRSDFFLDAVTTTHL